MKSLFFWKSWEPAHRILYLILLGLFGLAIVYFIISLIIGADSILSWESLMQSEAAVSLLDNVEVPPFSLPVFAESYIFLDFFNGSEVQINQAAYYIFLGFVAVGMAFILSVMTYLPRFWYMVTMGLFIVLLIFFKLELLLLFDSTNKLALIIALVLFLPLSYYFHSFNKDAALHNRVLLFGGVILLFGLLTGTASEVSLPFMQLAVYGMPAFLIMALIFNLLVSHDIIAGFLNAVSSDRESIGNWKHFFFITGIYLLNVLVLYLNEIDVITWDIIPLNVFVLL